VTPQLHVSASFSTHFLCIAIEFDRFVKHRGFFSHRDIVVLEF
jgi:hypothetical protein